MRSTVHVLFLSVIALILFFVACADKEADNATTVGPATVAEDEGEVEGAAAIFSVKTLDFGDVLINTVSPVKQWTIKNNTSSRTLRITAFTADPSVKALKKKGNGTCGPLPWELGPGDSCSLNMVFKPTSEGEFSRNFTFHSANFGTGFRIRTTKGRGIRKNGGGGNGDEGELVGSDDQGTANTSFGIATITNTGDGDVEISSAEFSSSTGSLTEQNDGCSGATLQHNDSCEVTYGVCCAGCGASTGLGKITVRSNASNDPFVLNVTCQTP